MFQLGGNLPPVARLLGALPRRAAGRGRGGVTSAAATKPFGPLSLAAMAGATVRAASAVWRTRSVELVSGLLAALVTDGMTAVPKEEVKNFGPWRVHNTPAGGRAVDRYQGVARQRRYF